MNRYFVVLILFLLSQILFGQLKVHPLFSDNMVLQADKEIVVWGWGNPDTKVKVHFRNQEKSGVVGDNGKWKIILDKENYGGPDKLTIVSGDTTCFRNVMVGEVWICSGQSNMNMPLGGWGRVGNYRNEIGSANYPNIRLVTIPLNLSEKPADVTEVDGWHECSPESVELFSAAAYYFGLDLHRKNNFPVGLIHVSKGGTPIESWMSEDALGNFPQFRDEIEFVKNGSDRLFKELNREYKIAYKNWLDTLLYLDEGIKQKWFEENYDRSDWLKINVPSVWENEGFDNYEGVMWYAKEIKLPDNFHKQNLILSLGAIQDYDITYVNGQKVGEQLKRNDQSIYSISADINCREDIIIVSRVLDEYGVGGLWDQPEEIFIENESGVKLSLVGEWLVNPSLDFIDSNILPPERILLDRKSTILFNGMISPLIGFNFRGVIWYQGESNAERAYEYRKLFPAMINNWREKFGIGDFPFLYVQLANYKSKTETPVESSWAELRDAQLNTLSICNTGMAVTIDIGNDVDVHPKNKQEVGRRLSLIAENKVYGEQVTYSGPVLNNYTIDKEKVTLNFYFADSGLHTDNENLNRAFAVAGQDKIFYWANAEIKNKSVHVWSDKVENPLYLRYAWADNPKCILYNNDNLPASPFEIKIEP